LIPKNLFPIKIQDVFAINTNL